MSSDSWLNTFTQVVSPYNQERCWVSSPSFSPVKLFMSIIKDLQRNRVPDADFHISFTCRCDECCRLLWSGWAETSMRRIYPMLCQCGHSLRSLSHCREIHPVQMHKESCTKGKWIVKSLLNPSKYIFLQRSWNSSMSMVTRCLIWVHLPFFLNMWSD